ncbi:antirestriction protein ArdA [Agrobacterium sp. ES01]|uniref:antirestriction protein ArdA n=1 Tax=Agrobacterium sp. ES01 TaxID=3420714 RepID=UPI003D138536
MRPTGTDRAARRPQIRCDPRAPHPGPPRPHIYPRTPSSPEAGFAAATRFLFQEDEMTLFFAMPYDISATGFYFQDEKSFRQRIGKVRNAYGQPVEEFEIQFIDGEAIDCTFANAWGINQANIGQFMQAVDEWDEGQKLRFIIAVGECGYSFDPANVDPDDFDVDIYEEESMKALAERFVDEGLFGEIPGHLAHYIDYDAIARDLSVDYTETEIAGERLIFRCQ